jgi:hypothetical protein
VAATDADIFVFNRIDFVEFLSLYPALRKTLEEACLLHYKESMEGSAKASGLEVIIPAEEGVDFSLSQVNCSAVASTRVLLLQLRNEIDELDEICSYFNLT